MLAIRMDRLAVVTEENMKLIDVDNMEIRRSGLDYIDPTDRIAIAHYFVDQVRGQDEVKAIPCDFIYNLINDPANAGSKSRVLSWLLREWEKDHADAEDDKASCSEFPNN